jgi:hypothetical protein
MELRIRSAQGPLVERSEELPEAGKRKRYAIKQGRFRAMWQWKWPARILPTILLHESPMDDIGNPIGWAKNP